ncbi:MULTISPECIES: DUF6776 family protein [Lysobacter]|jgi:heme exporter protein D|uniref:Transmembrane protein n=1 Tax=Lysobacter gummosus TaxID=262324 RepID=A0ABY3XFE4_9GAMM|nr:MULTISPECIES: DUF6776 family protein [Lysobacter]ALN89745.1 putative transmembrane protein [Lysobacter gummosus]UJB18359.1 hypothetical protein L1A79_18770 [Lysobacter capsici]UJQ27917.1 hypothetical protein L2D09_21115 [Lysobacter gummosus]UNP30359.1 hypothetical protein MOV92_03510 [Lysobacter gummosus]
MSKTPPPRFVIVQQQPDKRPYIWSAVGVAWALSLVVAWLWSQSLAAPKLPKLSAELDQTKRELRLRSKALEQLEQREANLQRSDQISRAANKQVQNSLAQREEEISDLRADVAFYERLVGATAPAKGLNVHSVEFKPETGGTWRYQIVLTQNLNRGAVSSGGLQFQVEGVRGGKLAAIGWDELHQKSKAPAQDYSFRYFQQLDGSVMLPAGFTPQRVRISLHGENAAIEQHFAWKSGVTVTGET